MKEHAQYQSMKQGQYEKWSEVALLPLFKGEPEVAMGTEVTGREEEMNRMAMDVQNRVAMQLITLIGILRLGWRRRETIRQKYAERER